MLIKQQSDRTSSSYSVCLLAYRNRYIAGAWVGPEGDTAVMMAAKNGDVKVTVKGGDFDGR